MEDLTQYDKYPAIQYAFDLLTQEDNRPAHKSASRIIHKLNLYLKQLGKSNLDKDLKILLLLLLRREFIRRIEENNLDRTIKDCLRNYVTARTKEERKPNTQS